MKSNITFFLFLALAIVAQCFYSACTSQPENAGVNIPAPSELMEVTEVNGLEAHYWRDSLYIHSPAFKQSKPTVAYVFDSSLQVVLLAKMNAPDGEKLTQIAFENPIPGKYLLQVYTDDGYLLTRQVAVYP